MTDQQTAPEISEPWKKEFIELRRKQYNNGYQDAHSGICARDISRTYLEGYSEGLKTTKIMPQSSKDCLDCCVADERIYGDDDFIGNG